MSKKDAQVRPVRIVAIGGEDRPLYFGFNAIALVNELTNTTLAEIQGKFTPPPEVIAQVQAAKEAGQEPEVDWEPAVTAGELRALAYAGLKDGARRRKLDFPFTLEDIGDWLDEADRATIEQIFSAHASAHDAGADPEEKGTEGKAPKKGKKK